MSFWSSKTFLTSLITATGGRILQTPEQGLAGSEPIDRVNGISTDSRQVKSGSVFFALKGERTDGHAYLAQACASHPCVVVVHTQPVEPLPAEVTVVLVQDTGAALLALGAAYRASLSHKTRVIAVGGSNGKTTTCKLLHSVLSAGLRGSVSQKSFNNAIGVPLTILAGQEDSDYLICEIGTNSPGEVAPLIKAVSPNISIVTSIGREHLEGFGDIEGVMREECNMVDGAPELTLLPSDSPRFCDIAMRELRQRGATRRSIVTFGFAPGSDAQVRITAADELRTEFLLTFRDETVTFAVPLCGSHNALNAAAAVLVAAHLRVGADSSLPGSNTLNNVSIQNAIASATGAEMRMQRREVSGITIINDAYNANPDSMLAAIRTFREVFASKAHRGVLILGDMLELGDSSPAAHIEVLRAAQGASDALIVVGSRMSQAATGLGLTSSQCTCISDVAETSKAASVAAMLKPGDTVLLKASRGTGLERVVKSLEGV